MRDGNDDIVQYNTYDVFGRPDSSFKAFFKSNSDHNFVKRSEFPTSPLFELTEYEANPLDRINRIDPFGGATTKDMDFVYGAETFSGSMHRFVETTDENDIKRKEYFDKFDN